MTSDKKEGIDSDMFLMEMGSIQRFNTLNEKLNWIARRLYMDKLLIGKETFTEHEKEEYHRIFTKHV